MDVVALMNQGRIPAERISRRGEKRVYGILHFGLNTFTGREWGFGDESPELFNPSAFDADQIVRGCRDGGLTGIVIVCKHHDGFCLWPTRTTEFNISQSPWRGGKGDFVREMSDACRKYGLDAGFYVSPWDRNHSAYGTPEYLAVYREQLREIYTNYGEAFEAWFDGANGGDGWYGGANETRKIDHSTYYDWANTWRIVRELQPHAAIFSDIGPDLRWVGNEKGFAGEESFGSYTPHAPESGRDPAPGFVKWQEGVDGHADGRYYIPPECDVPLRPGWFYHQEEDDALRSLPLLMQIYLRSVGCGGFLNLGIAPDRRGLLHEHDVARLKEFKAAVDGIFATPVAEVTALPDAESGEIHVRLDGTTRFNLLELSESLEAGEAVNGYEVRVRENGIWRMLLTGRAIGAKRLKVVPPTMADRLTLRLTSRHAVAPAPIRLALYAAPETLLNPEAATRQPGSHHVTLSDLTRDGNTLTGTLEGAPLVCGFVFTPEPEGWSGTPDRYEFAVSEDGCAFRTVASGEFANIRANPIPQQVKFAPTPAKNVRFRAIRMLEDGVLRFHCIAVLTD